MNAKENHLAWVYTSTKVWTAQEKHLQNRMIRDMEVLQPWRDRTEYYQNVLSVQAHILQARLDIALYHLECTGLERRGVARWFVVNALRKMERMGSDGGSSNNNDKSTTAVKWSALWYGRP